MNAHGARPCWAAQDRAYRVLQMRRRVPARAPGVGRDAMLSRDEGRGVGGGGRCGGESHRLPMHMFAHEILAHKPFECGAIARLCSRRPWVRLVEHKSHSESVLSADAADGLASLPELNAAMQVQDRVRCRGCAMHMGMCTHIHTHTPSGPALSGSASEDTARQLKYPDAPSQLIEALACRRIALPAEFDEHELCTRKGVLPAQPTLAPLFLGSAAVRSAAQRSGSGMGFLSPSRVLSVAPPPAMGSKPGGTRRPASRSGAPSYLWRRSWPAPASDLISMHTS